VITILGAGGAIGNELVKVLAEKHQLFRLVGRNPKPTPGRGRNSRRRSHRQGSDDSRRRRLEHRASPRGLSELWQVTGLAMR